MWPTLLWMVAGWSCFVLGQEPPGTDNIIYKKEGDEVVFHPVGPFTHPIISIEWRDGPNIAIQWDKNDEEVTYYRQFQVHCILNTTSGEVTIKNLIRDHSGVYTPQINSIKGTPVDLKIMSTVPVPTVSISCDADKCTLKCVGNTKGVEQVTYKWKSDDTELPIASKEYTIEKESSQSISEFSCELKNPVSQESSEPVANPFNTSEEGGLKINSGLTVFITLLAVLLLLVLIHRWRAGSWFFEKDALPWEAEFWRKQPTSRRDAAESNGIQAHQEQGQGEEETAMT